MGQFSLPYLPLLNVAQVRRIINTREFETRSCVPTTCSCLTRKYVICVWTWIGERRRSHVGGNTTTITWQTSGKCTREWMSDKHNSRSLGTICYYWRIYKIQQTWRREITGGRGGQSMPKCEYVRFCQYSKNCLLCSTFYDNIKVILKRLFVP